MEQKKDKSQLTVVAIFVIAAVVFGAYYLWPSGEVVAPGPVAGDYFTLTIIDEDLTEEEINRYQERFDSAVQEAQTIDDFVNPWLEIGSIKKAVGDYEGAEAAWLQANEIRPGNSTSFGNLADLYTNFLVDYEKAIPMYETAIANSQGEFLNTQFYRRYYEFYLYHLKDYEKTEELLLQGIKDNPADSELVILLAQFYFEQRDDVAKAIEYYEKAYVLDPDDTRVEDEIKRLKSL